MGIVEISKFISHHKIAGDQNGNYFFQGKINVIARSENRSDVSRVWINMTSTGNGKTSFTETRSLNTDWCHGEFHPDWQQFQFDEDGGQLVIFGKSSKMGPYEVQIAPT